MTTLLAVLAACGTSPAASAPAAPPFATPTALAPTSTPAITPTAEPTPAVQVADFKVTAYQGDATFGGHDGHFAATFAAGLPVVLLYYGGL